MRKTCLSALVLFLLASQTAFASYEPVQPKRNPVARTGIVIGRGILNIVGLPAEIVTTGIREQRMHSRLWPVTYTPRLIYNMVVRISSGVNDVGFFPWIVAYTDDISPFTEISGLPEYPWQV